MFTDDGTKGSPISPRVSKVSHGNSLTILSDTLRPFQELLLCLYHLKVENEGPYKSKNDLRLSINNICNHNTICLDLKTPKSLEKHMSCGTSVTYFSVVSDEIQNCSNILCFMDDGHCLPFFTRLGQGSDMKTCRVMNTSERAS